MLGAFDVDFHSGGGPLSQSRASRVKTATSAVPSPAGELVSLFIEPRSVVTASGAHAVT